MSLNLPHSAELGSLKSSPVIDDLDTIIERWINAKLLPEVLDFKNGSDYGKYKIAHIGVRPPSGAETHDDDKATAFYDRLNEILKPLGYCAAQDHDGYGDEEVIIEWIIPEAYDCGDKITFSRVCLQGGTEHVEGEVVEIHHDTQGANNNTYYRFRVKIDNEPGLSMVDARDLR